MEADHPLSYLKWLVLLDNDFKTASGYFEKVLEICDEDYEDIDEPDTQQKIVRQAGLPPSQQGAHHKFGDFLVRWHKLKKSVRQHMAEAWTDSAKVRNPDAQRDKPQSDPDHGDRRKRGRPADRDNAPGQSNQPA